MSQSIMSKVCDKYNQYLRMEYLKLPVFLNTEEKYNELVRKTDMVKKYEKFFTNYWKMIRFL